MPLRAVCGRARFLETERLARRRFTEGDVGLLVELDSDPEVMHFVTGGRPTSRREIETELLPACLGYYERYAGYGFWAAIERSTGDFIGEFLLSGPRMRTTLVRSSSGTGCAVPPGARGMRRKARAR